MLSQHRIRWANIEPALNQRLVSVVRLSDQVDGDMIAMLSDYIQTEGLELKVWNNVHRMYFLFNMSFVIYLNINPFRRKPFVNHGVLKKQFWMKSVYFSDVKASWIFILKNFVIYKVKSFYSFQIKIQF